MRQLMVDLLRHGQTGGRTCFRGDTDDPLSGLDWGQMRLACPPRYARDAIYTSPLMRCQDSPVSRVSFLTCPQSLMGALPRPDMATGENRGAGKIMRYGPSAWRAGFATRC